MYQPTHPHALFLTLTPSFFFFFFRPVPPSTVTCCFLLLPLAAWRRGFVLELQEPGTNAEIQVRSGVEGKISPFYTGFVIDGVLTRCLSSITYPRYACVCLVNEWRRPDSRLPMLLHMRYDLLGPHVCGATHDFLCRCIIPPPGIALSFLARDFIRVKAFSCLSPVLQTCSRREPLRPTTQPLSLSHLLSI